MQFIVGNVEMNFHHDKNDISKTKGTTANFKSGGVNRLGVKAITLIVDVVLTLLQYYLSSDF